MPELDYGVFAVDYDVQRFDTVDVTVYFVVPGPILKLLRKIDPSIKARYRLGSETFSPKKDTETLKAQVTVGPRRRSTGFKASATVTLDVAKVTVAFQAMAEVVVLGKPVAGSPWKVDESWTYKWPRAPILPLGKAKIANVVVVMLENRSFDNLVGWLYKKEGNRPPKNLPRRKNPTYDGLKENTYWNPTTAKHVRSPDKDVPEDLRVYVTDKATDFTVPAPDPHEQFRQMNYQIFGKKWPAKSDPETMKGFVVNYADAIKESGKEGKGVDPGSIMECYSPGQMGVLSALARNYAISDRWFASLPCQTWPNRGFMHAGTSCGRVNNLNKNKDDNTPPNPLYYDTRTIFNVLHDLGISWKVYGDSILPTLTRYQFATQLWSPLLDCHFRSFDDFKNDATLGTLPSYSFVEPDFLLKKNDEHPPHDVRKAETFLYDIWKAVSEGAGWENTLLIITYDEHGGCYDHVAPPRTAVKPDNSKPQKPFDFKRFGVRVPTVLVSPWIEAGTVFRSSSKRRELDHTSILATLRDWQNLSKRAGRKWLKSKRIAAAPTLGRYLTRSRPRKDKPKIRRPAKPAATALDTPLDPLQASVAAAALMGPEFSARRYREVAKEVVKLKSLRHAVKRLEMKI